MTTHLRQPVRLRPLTVVPEGDGVLVGDPEAGTFVTMPVVGGVIISALRRGDSWEQVTAAAETEAGEPVDLTAFVATLAELGFVDDDASEPRTPERTAPVQGRRWLVGVSQRLVRPFFGATAWGCYVVLTFFCIGVFALVPELFPTPAEDAFFTDIGLSAILLGPMTMLTMALHECGHWLAARAAGVRARFGIDRRAMLVVFETDLTQLWSLPRRQRYSPLLGGMAADVVVLSVFLGARLLVHTGTWSAPSLADNLLAAGVYLKLAGLLWQCMVFLRTDLYAVLVTLLGCHNLWRVKTLMLRQAFRRLTPEQARELGKCSAVDRRAARWFRWVWLAGNAGLLVWFTFFVAPVIVVVVDWAARDMVAGPLHWSFWYGLLCSVVLIGPYVLAAALAVTARAQRQQSDAVRDEESLERRSSG